MGVTMMKTITRAACAAFIFGVVVPVMAPAMAAMPNKTAIAVPDETDSVLAGSEYTKLPESWELSYHIAISPFIEDYKRCLGYGNLVFDGSANVEAQHRTDIPRCMKVKAEAIEQSNAMLTRRNSTDIMPPAKVEEAFDVLGYIHIQRGRNLDDQFKLQARAAEERRHIYEAQIAARDAALKALKTKTVESPDAEN